MKKIIIILLFFPVLLNAQKHDYNWVVGDNISDKVTFKFHSQPVEIKHWPNNRVGFIVDTPVLSDSLGTRLAIGNGKRIFNREFEIMENGDSINYGQLWDITTTNQGSPHAGYLGEYGNIFLPFPGKSNQYVYFHVQFLRDSFIDIEPEVFRYSILDMEANNGLGKVGQKNVELVDGRILWPAACKHGNGRDWWVLTGDMETPIQYLFLVTKDGVEGPFDAGYGPEWTDFEGNVQCDFSPDGNLYIRHDGISGLRIFDFDRCTGELSNLRIIPYKNGFYSIGMAFSSDSRYLYLSDLFRIYQIDLLLDDPFSHIDTLQDVRGSSSLTYATLCPDDKIYFTPYFPGHKHLKNAINFPRLPGLSADVQQYFPLPSFNANGMPHPPNYRLGEWEGAVCDTINLQMANDGFLKTYYNRKNELKLNIDQTVEYHTTQFGTEEKKKERTIFFGDRVNTKYKKPE